MEPLRQTSATNDFPALLQVGALPVRFENGETEILLLTSRETKRWVIPKGWPIKGIKNWAAAAREAKEEAGIVGMPRKKLIGSFLHFKRRMVHFDLCRVGVYVLDYGKRLDNYREKGQREARWFSVEEAANRVRENGLIALLRDLSPKIAGKKSRKKRRPP
jgi:8-oxo-dGTP pyrophosphatase MutT (NUDIX family)